MPELLLTFAGQNRPADKSDGKFWLGLPVLIKCIHRILRASGRHHVAMWSGHTRFAVAGQDC